MGSIPRRVAVLLFSMVSISEVCHAGAAYAALADDLLSDPGGGSSCVAMDASSGVCPVDLRNSTGSVREEAKQAKLASKASE